MEKLIQPVLWPHPYNEKINKLFKSIKRIYVIATSKDRELLERCKNYILFLSEKCNYRKDEPFELSIKEIVDGIDESEKNKIELLRSSDVVMCIGGWSTDTVSINQYDIAKKLSKPVIQMNYDSNISVENTIRYMIPLELLKTTTWDDSKKGEILVFKNSEGYFDLIDGNHRHELAGRLNIKTLSGWILQAI
jgi:hypothetical protein